MIGMSLRGWNEFVITDIAISGYRSIRDIVFPLSQITIVTGPNGTGKSSFYRALRLLADVAFGKAIASLASEGGLASTLWAGPERGSKHLNPDSALEPSWGRRNSAALKLGFVTKDYGYAIDLGFPIGALGSAFNLDPVVKAEALWVGERLSRRNLLMSRAGSGVTLLRANGKRETLATAIETYDSLMQYATFDGDFTELLFLRETMRAWRFYDNLRTDNTAPARQPQIGTRTPVLSADGRDLAAAIQTILEIGDSKGLATAIDETFPGSRLEVQEDGGNFSLLMHQRGLLRPLKASELSEGTLSFIMLAAALLTPRPPPLMVLNEPERCLNPSLMLHLAKLISTASRNCQIIVVSHQSELVSLLQGHNKSSAIELEKHLGETICTNHADQMWEWPSR
jgi:predicted ATPase